MRKAIPLAALGLVMTLTALAQEKPQGAATTEPPLEFVLEIDGQKMPMTADAPTKITVGGKEVIAKLTVLPDRLFQGPSVSFRYPRQHAFAADATTPGMTQWTLDGDSNVLIVQHVDEKVDQQEMVKDLVDGLKRQFGARNVKRSKGEVSLGGKKYPATGLTATIVSEKIHFDIVPFAAGEGTYVLMIQDSVNDDGSQSAETKQVLELLDKTFKLGK